jgi:hypothetical protein
LITESHVQGVAVFHLGFSYGQSHWGYSSAEEMRQGIAPVERNVENPEMPQHPCNESQLAFHEQRLQTLWDMMETCRKNLIKS